MTSTTALMVAIAIACPTVIAAAPAVLVKDGKPTSAIHVPPSVMEVKPDESSDHKRLRLAVTDLADYIEKMTGAKIPINTRQSAASDKAAPILIGSYADGTFGKYTEKSVFKQGWRLAVSGKGVGVQGETEEAATYAIYEILDRLGCRWYMPGDIGEHIPKMKTVSLPEMDLKLTPATVQRNIWYADEDFKRRNRMGGFPYAAGHALEIRDYITKEQLEAHPDWNAEIGGKRSINGRFCWGNPEVAQAVAEGVIRELKRQYVPCISISPEDGSTFCECEKCRALDTGDWDVTMGRESITDRYIHFANQIAERVSQVYPDVKLGFLAYVQFTYPPLREKLHPNLIPQLAPINLCRMHTVSDKECPTRYLMKDFLTGWSKASKDIAMYEYFFNLAEVSAPFPMIKRNVEELPLQYANNVTMWTPEGLPNFDTALPGLYLGMRMSWYTKADPETILNEFYTNFYGASASAMKDYWQYIDDRYTTVPDHSGSGFGYQMRFTPEAMTKARELMNAAIAKCDTVLEYRRVKIADYSLRQFELFMKIRENFFDGNFADLESDSVKWVAVQNALADEYADNHSFTRTYWAKDTVAARWFNGFFRPPYTDASRIAADYTIMTPTINTWSYIVDREKNGESLGWQADDFDDSDWKTTNVKTETWATLELMDYYGPVWYRNTINLPQSPDGKRVYLWIGSSDGRCKVFVNGRHVPFVTDENEVKAESDGYCQPFSFDVTDVAKPGANQITIIGTRHFINELGTGGLLGPVVIYREK